jgi:hypothetical protein
VNASLILSAAAPTAYAFVIERFGERAALHVSILVASVALGAALILKRMFPSPAAER